MHIRPPKEKNNKHSDIIILDIYKYLQSLDNIIEKIVFHLL